MKKELRGTALGGIWYVTIRLKILLTYELPKGAVG